MARKLKDDDLLLLMLSGKSQTVIAKELGVTKATLTRRLHTPEFAEMLSQYRKKLLDAIITDLSTNAQKAVAVLVRLLDDDSSKIRLAAADKILQITQDHIVLSDLMREVEAIKKAQQEI